MRIEFSKMHPKEIVAFFKSLMQLTDYTYRPQSSSALFTAKEGKEKQVVQLLTSDKRVRLIMDGKTPKELFCFYAPKETMRYKVLVYAFTQLIRT